MGLGGQRDALAALTSGKRANTFRTGVKWAQMPVYKCSKNAAPT